MVIMRTIELDAVDILTSFIYHDKDLSNPLEITVVYRGIHICFWPLRNIETSDFSSLSWGILENLL